MISTIITGTNLIGGKIYGWNYNPPEVRMAGLAIVLWISMYSTYWACGKLYDYKCDIFNLFKKKKKKRKS